MSSIGPVVTEEKMFENVDGRWTDGRTTPESLVSSGELILSGEQEKESIIHVRVG